MKLGRRAFDPAPRKLNPKTGQRGGKKRGRPLGVDYPKLKAGEVRTPKRPAPKKKWSGKIDLLNKPH